MNRCIAGCSGGRHVGLLPAGIMVCLLVCSSSADAAGYGRLEAWGSYGFGSGQFSNPRMMAVDSSDGSIYAGDLSQINPVNSTRENVRIQKLSGSGSFIASLNLARFSGEKPIFYVGIAVDPVLHRF